MPKTAICWRCREVFNYDVNDLRPFIYHLCPDDGLAANKNPNNKEEPYRYSLELLTPSELEIKRKKALNKMLKEVYG